MCRLAVFVLCIGLAAAQLVTIDQGMITDHPQASICHLPLVKGPCKGLFPKVYYNSATRQCEDFIYGGCYGNENNFDTMEQCTDACVNA